MQLDGARPASERRTRRRPSTRAAAIRARAPDRPAAPASCGARARSSASRRRRDDRAGRPQPSATCRRERARAPRHRREPPLEPAARRHRVGAAAAARAHRRGGGRRARARRRGDAGAHPQPARRPVPARPLVGRLARRGDRAAARRRRCCCRSPRSPAPSLALARDARPRERARRAHPDAAPCSRASPSRRSPARSRASSSSGPRRATATARSSTGCSARSPARAGRPSRSRAIALIVDRRPAARSAAACSTPSRSATRPRPRSACPCSGARWGCSPATALLTGALVSVSGAIGFVGLVLPHAVRLARRARAPRAAAALGARRRGVPGLGRHRSRARCSIRASCRSASSRRSSARPVFAVLLLARRRRRMTDGPRRSTGVRLRARAAASSSTASTAPCRRGASARSLGPNGAGKSHAAARSSPASSERMPEPSRFGDATSPRLRRRDARAGSSRSSSRSRTSRPALRSREVVALGRTPYRGASWARRPRRRAIVRALPRGRRARRARRPRVRDPLRRRAPAREPRPRPRAGAASCCCSTSRRTTSTSRAAHVLGLLARARPRRAHRARGAARPHPRGRVRRPRHRARGRPGRGGRAPARRADARAPPRRLRASRPTCSHPPDRAARHRVPRTGAAHEDRGPVRRRRRCALHARAAALVGRRARRHRHRQHRRRPVAARRSRGAPTSTRSCTRSAGVTTTSGLGPRGETERVGAELAPRAWAGRGSRSATSTSARTSPAPRWLREGAAVAGHGPPHARWRLGVRLIPATDDEVETHVRRCDGRPRAALPGVVDPHRAACPRSLPQRTVDRDPRHPASSRPSPTPTSCLSRRRTRSSRSARSSSVPGIREAILATRAPVVGVSPIIGGGSCAAWPTPACPRSASRRPPSPSPQHYGARSRRRPHRRLARRRGDAAAAIGSARPAGPLGGSDPDDRVPTAARIAADALSLVDLRPLRSPPAA